MSKKGWRQVIAQNERKTKVVISFFILMYVFIGLLVGIVFQSFSSRLNFMDALMELVTFHRPPFFTLGMCCVGVACVMFTFWFHDKLMLTGQDYVEINPENLNAENFPNPDFLHDAKQLYNIVEEMKIAARLRYMPKVYIIEADFMNAFASGYSEKSAMVAISQGLMAKLTRAEIQAVMAHEISHIRHMDIKLTLLVGVLTNIMLILVDSISHFFSMASSGSNKRENSESGNAKMVAMLILLVLRIFLPIITLFLTLFLSRTREFMADAGSISLTRDDESLASALKKIHTDYDSHDYEDRGGKTRQAAYIFNPFKSLISSDIMSTHPSLEKRLASMGMTVYTE